MIGHAEDRRLWTAGMNALRAEVAEMTKELDEAREEAAAWRIAANRDASQVAELRKALKRARTFHPHESSVTRQIDAALEMSGGMK